MTTTTDKPKSLHLFCGLGGDVLGFQRAGFEIMGAVDYEPDAIKDLKTITGVDGLVADIESWEPQDLVRHFPAPPDVVVMSPPCLPGEGLVVTPTGTRQIKTIDVGELVLTHKGRFRPVLKTGACDFNGDLIGFRLNGTVDVQEFTPEHPMWVRRTRRVKGKLCLGDADFVKAGDVKVGDHIGYPVDIEQVDCATWFIRALGDPQITSRSGKPFITSKVRDLTEYADDPVLWFLIGAYLGDGYRRESRNEVIYCVGPEGGNKAIRVRQALEHLGLSYSEDKHGGKTNIKIRTHTKHLSAILACFGDGAPNKNIPPELMHLECKLMDALIDGLRVTDGSTRPRRSTGRGNGTTYPPCWRITSTSLPMLRSLQRLLLRRGEYGMINVAGKGGPRKILGRDVNTLPTWEIKVATEHKRRPAYEFIDGTVWVRVRKIIKRPVTSEMVWNLEVDEDNTFCAPMMGTHNCQGNSGCLPSALVKTKKYQRLNDLGLRALYLVLEAWSGVGTPPLIVFENVPRIKSRSKELLVLATKLLQAKGYAVVQTTHDCGEVGGLAQHRRRFLMVARHMPTCPEWLYQPPIKRVRGVGEVLGDLPVPLPSTESSAGPLHKLPRLWAINWIRLALIRAGKDWKDLPPTVALEPSDTRHNGPYGVQGWEKPAHTVVGAATARATWSSVADPRINSTPKTHNGKYGVGDWDKPFHTVIATASPDTGWAAVADPRLGDKPRNGAYGTVGWDESSKTVVGSAVHDNSPVTVCDPRINKTRRDGSVGVTGWDKPSTCIIGQGIVQNGPWQVADPRLEHNPRPGGHGVVDWPDPAKTVIGEAGVDKGHTVADPRLGYGQYNGAHRVVDWVSPTHCIIGNTRVQTGANVADPRPPVICGQPPLDPKSKKPCHVVICSTDGTWHRPMTTLELAVLQGLPAKIDGEWLELEGNNKARWRKRIGNAIPPPAAEAIALSCLTTLKASRDGGFLMSACPVWVAPEPVEVSVS